MTTATARHRSELTRPDHGRTLRLDIEGMRTIAVGSVLLFHAGLPWFEGGFVGVDVFFVLSGFLITGLLAREVSRSGRVRIGNFWARRVKRLLPASATVLAFSALVTYVYLPVTQREDFGGDIAAAGLYVVNWQLADRSVDYLAEGVGASPVQHYWSLSVEEQFYVVWPLLMLIVGLVAAKRWKVGAFAILGLVTATSFAYSVVQSQSNPDTAFFVSTTRIWELGIGALLALAAARVAKLPDVLRASGGWAGIGLIGYAVLFFDGSTTWPGVAALVPTLGAALMIASGLDRTAGSPQRLLSLKPMVWIGGLSYSIYLWHWPMLIAAQAQYPDLRLRWTVLLMVVSIVPAYLCHRFIENPIRFGVAFKPTGRALVMGAGLTAAGVAIGFGLSASASIGTPDEASVAEGVGAAALVDKANAGVVWSDINEVDAIRPLPINARDDRVRDAAHKGCQSASGDPKPRTCVFGDPDGDRTVVMVGDSKVQQWESAISDIAAQRGWRLVQITKSACAFADHVRGSEIDKDCREWGAAALQKILDMNPDLVIASQRHGSALKEGTTELSPDAMVDGITTYTRAITAQGIPSVTLLDNPDPGTAVHECVAEHPDDLSFCAFDKARGVLISGAATQRKAAELVKGVSVVDMTDLICPDADRCAAVIGRVLVYRQGSHLTRTYVDSMRPMLAERFARATNGLFGAP